MKLINTKEKEIKLCLDIKIWNKGVKWKAVKSRMEYHVIHS